MFVLIRCHANTLRGTRPRSALMKTWFRHARWYFLVARIRLPITCDNIGTHYVTSSYVLHTLQELLQTRNTKNCHQEKPGVLFLYLPCACYSTRSLSQ